MTGARTSFTCSTELDQDLIEWLDSFSGRDRGYAIKAAIRAYMDNETNPSPPVELDLSNLSSLGEQVSDLYRVIIAVQKQNEKILALSINNDIIVSNKDLSDSDEIDPAVLGNIGNLFKE